MTTGYAEGWAAVNRLVREGLSWSGREANTAYLNLGDGRFADVSRSTGLDFKDDGRALARVDWDQDGDLDLWVVNRSAPQVRFLRNENPAPGASISLRLVGDEVNRDAIGARVRLRAGSKRMLRFVQAGSGYISQSSKWLHFSTPGLDRVDEIEVRWPDGRVQRFAGVETGARYLVRQGAEALQAVARHGEREGVRLQPTTQAAVEQSEVASIGLTWRLPVPTVAVTDFEEREHRIGSGGKPLLVNLWSSWCPSCLHELDQWTREREKLAPALDILALAVDELQADVGEQPARDVIADLGCWFPAGSATDELLLLLEVVQSSVVDRLRQLPVPASFLFDAEGKLARIYKGPVQPEALLADVAKLSLTGMEAAEAALPFEGSWHEGPHLPGFLRIADRLLEQEAPTPAAYFVTAALPYAGDVGETTRARIVQLLARAGNLLIEGKQMEEARALFRQATQIDPMQPALWEKLGLTSTALGDANAALAAYRRATEIDGTRAEGWLAIGVQQMLAGDADAALESLGRAVELNPDLAMGWKGVGRIRCSRGERDAGAAALERALTLAPDDAHAQGLLDACR